MIKKSIQEEDLTIINIYAPNIGGPEYTRRMLTTIKGEINSKTVMVGDFYIPLMPIDRSSRQKIREALNWLPWWFRQ